MPKRRRNLPCLKINGKSSQSINKTVFVILKMVITNPKSRQLKIKRLIALENPRNTQIICVPMDFSPDKTTMPLRAE
jgi:hypothetical protein